MNGVVLIADSDTERSKRLVEACSRRGIASGRAAHGAAALELALSEVPRVVVAQLDLPLVDGPRLAAILGSNPRTRGIHFLFLADIPGEAPQPDLGGEVIVPPIDAEEIVRRVQSRLADAPVDEETAVPKDEGERQIEGQLSQLSLADLLQLLHLNRRTGTVELEPDDAEVQSPSGRVYLRDGDVIQAVVGRVDGEKAFYRLIGWRRGRFAFTPNRVTMAQKIARPTRALLMEGMRQIDERARLAGSLPPADAVVTLTPKAAELRGGLHPLTQEVVLLLKRHWGVQAIVDHSTFPDYQVLRTLHALIARGIVHLERDPSNSVGELREEYLASPEQVERLRHWLEPQRQHGRGAAVVKLLVVSPEPAATLDFAQLLLGLPGVRLERGFVDGGVGADDLAMLGRVSVDADHVLELVHVPASDRFAPLWPMVAHGAIGTLFLLTSPVAESTASIAQSSAMLRNVPRTRSLHLLLERKGESLSTEEVQEHLCLLDASSLLRVSLESREPDEELLRSVFARVLP